MTDPLKVPGYFENKFKYNVKSVADFIGKMQKIQICHLFFHGSNPKWAGLSQVFSDFYVHVKQKML